MIETNGKRPDGTLSQEELRTSALRLHEDFVQTLLQIPEFREAAVHAFLNRSDIVHFERDGTRFAVHNEPFPYRPSKYLMIRVLGGTNEHPLVTEEMTIEVCQEVTGRPSKLLYWSSSDPSPLDLPYTPDWKRNSRGAISGAESFLKQLQISTVNP